MKNRDSNSPPHSPYRSFTRFVSPLLIILVVTVFRSRVFAASGLTTKERCTFRDLRNDPRLPPAKSQGGNAWCFAYAMATLTGFALNEPVSAVGFVMAPTWARGLNKGEMLKQTLNETDMPQMFSETQNWGFCREKDLPSDLIHAGIKNLDEAYDMIALGQIQPVCSYSQSLNIEQERNINLAFPMASIYDIVRTYSDLSSEDAALFQLGKESCKQHRFTPQKKLNFNFLKSGGASLNEHLDQNKPVGVNYRTKAVLKTPKDFGHASTIIGRQWKNGTCEFLIRDPYGPQTLSTRPNTNGDIWVPESDLVKGHPGLWSVD